MTLSRSSCNFNVPVISTSGFSGPTGYFSSGITAVAGYIGSLSGSSATFSGLLTASGGITATTGYFTEVSSNTVFLRDSTNTYSNATIGQTGDAVMISMSTIGGTAGSLYINPVGQGYIPKADINGTKITWNITGGGETDFINLAIGPGSTSSTGFNFYAGADGNTASLIGQIRPYIPPIDSTLNLATTAWVTNAISSGTSTTASRIALTNDNSSGTFYIPFSNGTGTSQQLYLDSVTGPLTYVPLSGVLSVPGNINCGGTGFFQTLKIAGYPGITGPVFSVTDVNASGLVQPAGNNIDRGLQYYWGNTGSAQTPLLEEGMSHFLNLGQSSGGGFAFHNTRSAGYLGAADNTKTLLQIDSSANAYFYGNVTAPTFIGALNGNATTATNATNATNINLTPNNTSGIYYIPFASSESGSNQLYTDNIFGPLTYNPNTSILGVSGITAATATFSGQVTAASFNATSDYRIKENPVPIVYTVDALRPLHYFNKATNKEDFGFLAHEVQEIFPFLVQGEKDGDSNQSLNYMGIIALLVKEVQELKQKINNII